MQLLDSTLDTICEDKVELKKRGGEKKYRRSETRRFAFAINTLPRDLVELLAVQFIRMSEQCLLEKRANKSDARNSVRAA